LAGTLIGAFIIETMDNFVIIAITPRSTDVFKAGVVFVVCILQSPQARAMVVNAFRRTPPPPPEITAPTSGDVTIPADAVESVDPVAGDAAASTEQSVRTSS